EYAKSQGVMFDPVTLDHDEFVARAVRACAQVTRKQVAEAFLASLTTRRLELRSALASYAVGRHMPLHRFKANDPDSHRCLICGQIISVGRTVMNVQNFE